MYVCVVVLLSFFQIQKRSAFLRFPDELLIMYSSLLFDAGKPCTSPLYLAAPRA
jgi:hypothetical protein